MIFAWASIWLLIPVGIFVMGVRAAWVSMTLPRKVPREAACGRCTYPVAGLASPTCPECGSDFRVVGISTPRFVLRWRGGYTSGIVGWTLAVLMLGLTSAWMISMYAISGAMVTGGTSWSAGLSETLTPGSGSVRTFEFSSDQSWTGGSLSQTVTVVATLPDGSEQTFTLDTTAGTYTTDDGTGKLPPATFDGDSVTAWLVDLGLDETDTSFTAEARDLTRMVDVAAQAPGNSVSGIAQRSFTVGSPKWNNATPPGGTGSAPGSLAVVGYSIAFGIFALWVGGIVWICVRRSRLLAA